MNVTTYRELCSGYGGLGMAVEQVTGAVLVDHAETDANAAKVHEAHWPDIPNIGDITTADWSALEPTDILCAGFPCQPISRAGQRKVTNDARWIWPHIADAVRVLRPRCVILENVALLLRLWRDDDGWWNPAPVEEVVGSLAGLGYVGSWRCVRASDVGAPHQRERVFIVATDPVRTGLERRRGFQRAPRNGTVAAHDRPPAWGPYEPAIRQWERLTRPAPPAWNRRGNLSPKFSEWMMGLPEGWVTGTGISHTAQLKCIGNGVVPQQATYALADMLDRMEATCPT